MNYKSFLYHIPHSSMFIPNSFGDIYNDKLIINIQNQTDLYVDDLFNVDSRENIKSLEFGFNRFYCDVERFWDDNLEPMSAIGQGVYYTNFIDGSSIGRIDSKDDIKNVYDKHHKKLNELSSYLVSTHGDCLIIDCHSFNDGDGYVDICIGLNYDENDIDYDSFKSIIETFIKNGYSITVNNPYKGSIYPSEYKSDNLKTVMIEINKRCYLNEDSTKNIEKYNKLKSILDNIFGLL